MKSYRENPFVFSPKYRLLRHLVFWIADAVVFTLIFRISSMPLSDQLVLSLIWVPLHMAFAYPVMFIFIPRLLMKEKHGPFVLVMLVWGVAGWFWNYVCRVYIFFGFVHSITGIGLGNSNPWAANSYLSMVAVAGLGSTIILFKYWMQKQKDFLTEQKEKINMELQILKAQIHPHFLFNTLNNIYSFSIQGSEKTPAMIAKLSSLLSYILYDCKSNTVLLEKEIEVMKNYIDLEKERYGNTLEVSINIEGDIEAKLIAPLLLLPFIENAFKHGTSDQLEKPWLSIDISARQNHLRFKIVNSKNEQLNSESKGIGISNVKKRLAYLYPSTHELRINDEGNFFVVSLALEISPSFPTPQKTSAVPLKLAKKLST